MENSINIKLNIWRQRGPKEEGKFVGYSLDNVPTDISFLEMLDMLNEQLVEKGEEPVVFDNDCREGICGMCSLYINGTPHGKTERGATTCQLYMRRFNDGDVITVEPWRSAVSLQGRYGTGYWNTCRMAIGDPFHLRRHMAVRLRSQSSRRFCTGAGKKSCA